MTALPQRDNVADRAIGAGHWPALLDARLAAAYCGMSVRDLHRRRAAGAFPAPSVSTRDASGRPRFVRWSRAHLDLWIGAGLPEARAFARLAKAAREARP